MANSQQRLLSSLEFLVKEKCDFSNPLWRKLTMELQSGRRNCYSQTLQQMKSRRCRSRSMVMKRRARLDRCIRPINSIERKVRILKNLVPNCESEMGVERLFRETADYIKALQIRAKVMQIMVDVLSGSSSDDDNELI